MHTCGNKGTPYEGCHRVPCFLRWPKGGLADGRDVYGLTAHIDLLPTLIELCGLTKPEGLAFDGISLAQRLIDPHAPKDRMLFVAHLGGDLVTPDYHISPFQMAAVLTPRWRLVFGAELYDIVNDPMQKMNVPQQHPEIVKDLRKAQQDWFTDVTANLSTPCRIELGNKSANSVQLSLQDWFMPKGNPPWYQKAPYDGWSEASSTLAPYEDGPWMVNVANAGKYEITLRQLPAEANLPIQATTAKIQIGDVEELKVVPKNATAVTFTVQLDVGEQALKTWFTEPDGKTRGPFSVCVNYLSE